MSVLSPAANPPAPPLAFATFHTLQGLPCLVRIDHILSIVANIARAQKPNPNYRADDERSAEPPTIEIEMACTQLVILSSTIHPIVAEDVNQVCDIMNEAMEGLKRRVTGGGIAVPGRNF